MRHNSGLGQASELFSDCKWFQCASSSVDELDGPFCIQDTVHIATKLRCWLMKTLLQKKKFPFGDKFYIQIGHLMTILQNFSKDEHRLTASTLDPKDKQNFESVLRICDESVLCLLEEHVPRSDATKKFLEIIRDVIEAYSDENLSPLDRVDKIWYATFILRLWRQYIVSCPETTLKHNFLSQNCYVCIELNAHSLVMLMVYLKQNNMSQLFMPYLFSSQPCESFFRKIRSFTSTYSTVANCSIKEIIGRINKIQLQGDISYRSDYQYPRSDNLSHAVENEYILPTLKDIMKRIERSKKDAYMFARQIGLTVEDNIEDVDFSCKIPPFQPKKSRVKSFTKAKPPLTDQIFYPRAIHLKNFCNKFRHKSISEDSPYVQVYCKQMKTCIIKKTSFCWLLRTDFDKLSSDRLLRVQAKTQPVSNQNCYKKIAKKTTGKSSKNMRCKLFRQCKY